MPNNTADTFYLLQLLQSRLGTGTIYRQKWFHGTTVHYGTNLSFRSLQSIQRCLAWLWPRRALLPRSIAPLLCLKCATWIKRHRLHLSPEGKELGKLLEYGNKIRQLESPGEYLDWLTRLSSCQDEACSSASYVPDFQGDLLSLLHKADDSQVCKFSGGA